MTRRLVGLGALTIAAALLSGCEPGAFTQGGTTRGPLLGEFGIDTASMNPAIKPGDDFYRYVNGTWEANTEIPADRSSISSFSMLNNAAQQNTRVILEEAAGDAAASGDRKRVGD
ncbi:MAG TPA: hypothetical protein VGB49_09130, partial [Caulobacteraceae bacterium]